MGHAVTHTFISWTDIYVNDLRTRILMQNALKLANAALDKHADSSILKALKAMALIRTGKHDEANKVMPAYAVLRHTIFCNAS